MTTQTATVRNTGFPLTWMLGLLFIGLKLTGYIDWSWWWVLAPFWLPPAVVFGFAAIVMLFVGIVALIAAIFDR